MLMKQWELINIIASISKHMWFVDVNYSTAAVKIQGIQMFTFMKDVMLNSKEIRFFKKAVHQYALTQTTWETGNLSSQYSVALLAANIISYAWRQFCGTECLAMPATSNQDIVPQLCGGYQVRGQSKGAPFVMSCSGTQCRIDRKWDRGGEKEQKMELDRSRWGSGERREDCRIASTIRDGEINSGRNEKDWFGSETKEIVTRAGMWGRREGEGGKDGLMRERDVT